MASLQHPPPPPVHGLLSVKRGGQFQFAKRVRRLAQLSGSTLELRLREHGPVEWSASVLAAQVTADAAALTITLNSSSLRLRLYAHSAIKFAMWLRALRAAAEWHLSTFYELGAAALGEGSSAAVRAARDNTTGERVAVKTIPHPTTPTDPTPHPYLTQLVAREVRIARLLQHPSIIRVRDVFEEPRHVHIVMDLVPYTLHDVLRAKAVLDEPHAAHIMRSVLTAVAYLHNKNIVHRDIKPDNVLCDRLHEPPVVRLCDFGLANFTGKRGDIPLRKAPPPGHSLIPKRMRFADRRTDEPAFGPFSRPVYLSCLTEASLDKPRRRSTIGFHGGGKDGRSQNEVHGLLKRAESDKENIASTFASAIDGLTLTSAIGAPSYVAPELVQGQRYGKPVDVWGCGVLLFFMLAGYLPFEGNDAAEVVRKIRECEPDFSTGSWARVSEGAKRFVRMLMHADPRKRITAESALENEWLILHTTPPKPTPTKAL